MPVIYWDGYGLTKRASGIYHHGLHLAESLSSLGVVPEIISQEPVPPPLGKRIQEQKSRSFVRMILNSKFIWPLRTMHQINRLPHTPGGRDLIHALSNINLPLSGLDKKRFSTVLTVHDLIPKKENSGVSRVSAWQFNYLLPRCLERADAIVCVSQWTKADLCRFYPRVESRVRVIPNGMNELVQELTANTPSKVVKVLCVSRLEGYKRLDRLVTLARIVGKRMNVTLVTDLQGETYLKKVAPDLLVSGSFSVHRNLSPQEMACQFKNCDVYLHPSEYEGFCLPAAEAISYGKPVVYQKGSGIDETVPEKLGSGLESGAAPEDWLGAILTKYQESCEPDWPEVVKVEHGKKSSWNDAAKALKSIYDQLI